MVPIQAIQTSYMPFMIPHSLPLRGFNYITGLFEMLNVPAHCSMRFGSVQAFLATYGFGFRRGKRHGNNVGLHFNRRRYCL
jgi:hypothetical protein